MPYYDRGDGVKLYRDDACRSCSVIDICNVHSDLALEGTNSKYQETHIVEVGNSAGRENYIECQSYTRWVPMNERPDPNPSFGMRISQEQAAIQRDNPFQ